MEVGPYIGGPRAALGDVSAQGELGSANVPIIAKRPEFVSRSATLRTRGELRSLRTNWLCALLCSVAVLL
jgi:hypothetical protein